MSEKRILVVEDEEKIAQLLKDYLSRDGFDVSLLHDGRDAVATIRENEPDFVILDLMLPGKDGVAICRELRTFSDVPVLMLTARVAEIDRLVGLEVGADDYVCKPFLPREIVARVHTILRRVQRQMQRSQQASGVGHNTDGFITGDVTIIAPDRILNWQNIQLNLDTYECHLDQCLLELTPVEFRLLETLMGSPGRVFSRELMMTNAYPDKRVVSDRTIDSHVKNVRRKLMDANGNTDVIQSVYGIGYKFGARDGRINTHSANSK